MSKLQTADNCLVRARTRVVRACARARKKERKGVKDPGGTSGRVILSRRGEV